MKKEAKKIAYIFLKYLFVLLIALPNLFIFYLIFTPLTVYPVYFLLSLFYNVMLSGNTLILQGFYIEIIKACVAGSAYYLLVLLNFSVSLPFRKRILSLIFSLASFLFLNILRIFVFSILLVNSFQYFDITHKISWYLLSGIMLFFIWFLTIKIFKINEIPFYTDLSYIYKLNSNFRII